MRVNRGLLGWGVFFIVLGAVPLAVQQGALDADVVRRAPELWPLILIGIGLGLVLARTRFAVLGSLVVAATFGLMGGALLATGFHPGSGFSSCGFGTGGAGTPFADQRGSFTRDATVHLEMSCGDVSVTPADGTGWTVGGTSPDGRPPEIRRDDGRLAVTAPEHGGITIGAGGSAWQVTLPRGGPMAMELTVNAGSGRLDLSGMTIPVTTATVNAGGARIDLSGARGAERVEASVNAGSLVMLLPVPAATLRGSLSVNAGSASLCAPDGVALRFRGGDQALGSTNFEDRGLVRNGDTWSSPGFDAAATRIDMSVSANLGSITLDPEDGCD